MDLATGSGDGGATGGPRGGSAVLVPQIELRQSSGGPRQPPPSASPCGHATKTLRRGPLHGVVRASPRAFVLTGERCMGSQVVGDDGQGLVLPADGDVLVLTGDGVPRGRAPLVFEMKLCFYAIFHVFLRQYPISVQCSHVSMPMLIHFYAMSDLYVLKLVFPVDSSIDRLVEFISVRSTLIFVSSMQQFVGLYV